MVLIQSLALWSAREIFEAFLECFHEMIKVPQLWSIVIMEGDYPLHCGSLQCHGHTLNLGPLRYYHWTIFLHVDPDLCEEESQLFGDSIELNTEGWCLVISAWLVQPLMVARLGCWACG